MLKRNILVFGLTTTLLFGMVSCSNTNTKEINKPSTTIKERSVDKETIINLFKPVCDVKPRQKLKLDFLDAETAKVIDTIDLLDDRFQERAVITSELAEYVGPSWEWKFESYPYSLHELDSENSFAGLKLKLSVSDDEKEVASAFEGTVILNSNYMKDMILSDACYEIINTLHEGESKEFWQDKINTCYNTEETVLVESTDKSLTYLYKVGSAVYIYVNENTGY